jgi:YVTN family beta-propeller protein
MGFCSECSFPFDTCRCRRLRLRRKIKGSTTSNIIFVTNQCANTVQAISTSTYKVIATIPLAPNGIRPAGITTTPTGAFAFVACQRTNNVLVIDKITNTITGSPIPVGRAPFGIQISPNGSLVYVANSGDNTVSVINAITQTIVTTIPLAQVGGKRPQEIAFTADGSRALVTCRNSNNVIVINSSTNTIITTIRTGEAPLGVAVAANGLLYVVNSREDTVSVIDITNQRVRTCIPVGRHPQIIRINPIRALAYVSNFRSNTVSVISTRRNRVITDVPVGCGPVGVAPTPDGKLLYVNDFRSDRVLIIDAIRFNLIDKPIKVNKGPFLGTPSLQVSALQVSPSPTPSLTCCLMIPSNSSFPSTLAIISGDCQSETLTFTNFNIFQNPTSGTNALVFTISEVTFTANTFSVSCLINPTNTANNIITVSGSGDAMSAVETVTGNYCLIVGNSLFSFMFNGDDGITTITLALENGAFMLMPC